MRCMSSSCLSTTLKAGPGLRERGSGGAAYSMEQVGRVTCVPFGLADTYEHAHAEGISNGGFVAHNKSHVWAQGGTSTFLQASVSSRHSQLVTCSRPASPCRQVAGTSQPLSRRLTVQIARPVAAGCPTKGDLQPPSELRHATPTPAATRCMFQTLNRKCCTPQPTFHSSSPRSVSRSPSTSSAALAMVLHSAPHTPGPSCSTSVSLSPLSTCGVRPPFVSAASPGCAQVSRDPSHKAAVVPDHRVPRANVRVLDHPEMRGAQATSERFKPTELHSTHAAPHLQPLLD